MPRLARVGLVAFVFFVRFVRLGDGVRQVYRALAVTAALFAGGYLVGHSRQYDDLFWSDGLAASVALKKTFDRFEATLGARGSRS